MVPDSMHVISRKPTGESRYRISPRRFLNRFLGPKVIREIEIETKRGYCNPYRPEVMTEISWRRERRRDKEIVIKLPRPIL